MQVLFARTAARKAHNKGKSSDDEGDGGICKGGDEMVGSGGEEDGSGGEGDGGEGDGSVGGEAGGAERTNSMSIPVRPWVGPRVAVIGDEGRGRNGE